MIHLKVNNFNHMKPLSCLLFAVFLVSCIGDKFSVGDNLLQVNGRNMLIEDRAIELTTYQNDSAVTTGLNRIFEGKYTSPDFGVITAHSYFDFTPPSYSRAEFGPEAGVIVRFDSISLVLKYDNFSYGDTTRVQTIHVHRLNQNITLDDKNQLYSTSSIAAEADPWATRRFYRPMEYWENDSTLEIRLPDEFGLELIELMHSQSDLLETYDNFRTYFKGIKLSPGITDDAAVNSFLLDEEYPVIRLHYTTIGAVTTEENKIDMTINASTAFSRIETDRSNTPLNALSSLNPLPSSETGNTAYLQGLTGIYAKLSFGDLNELLQLGDHVIISSAILYVFPTRGTYNDFTPLPANLSLNYLDENDKPLDIYTDPETTTVQSGTLVEDKIYDRGTYYAFDITSYIQYEIDAIGMYKSSLQLSLAESEKNNTLKSLLFRDSSIDGEENRIQLIIYAIVYDND